MTEQQQRPVETLTYAEASEELDEIVAYFEGRAVDVDQLVVRLARAQELAAELDRRLRATRTQVEELLPRLQEIATPPSFSVDPETGELR